MTTQFVNQQAQTHALATLKREREAYALIATEVQAAQAYAHSQLTAMGDRVAPLGTIRWDMQWAGICKQALEEEMPERLEGLTLPHLAVVRAYVDYCVAVEAGSVTEYLWGKEARALLWEMGQ